MYGSHVFPTINASFANGRIDLVTFSQFADYFFMTKLICITYSLYLLLREDDDDLVGMLIYPIIWSFIVYSFLKRIFNIYLPLLHISFRDQLMLT